MKSSLSRAEFKKRLSELTAEEGIIYVVTPYDFSGKPFVGTFDDNTFDLSKNSFFKHVIINRIKGEYKDGDGNSTQVTFEVGWSTFARNTTKVLAILAVSGMNIFFLSIGSPVLDLLPLNLAAACLYGFGFTIDWITKKIVIQRFKEEFEIDVKDEWTSHSDSLIYKRMTKS